MEIAVLVRTNGSIEASTRADGAQRTSTSWHRFDTFSLHTPQHHGKRKEGEEEEEKERKRVEQL